MFRLAILLLSGLCLTGCETTQQHLLAQGYPEAFATGFDAGCSSGLQASGAISGEFRKDVPRYLADNLYSSGWDDGFRQCHEQALNAERRSFEERDDEQEQEWQRSKERALSRALFHSR